MNWDALRLSLQVTAVATLLIVAVGLPIALLLARRRFRGQTLLETLISLPLVLPPTVVGYYLLLFLGRNGPIVGWLDVQLLFTWRAAALASAIVGLPLLVLSARAAFAGVDRSLENAARTLGSSEVEILWRVTLPLARRGILAGLVLAAARALGEFGATLMVAGNIPGRTQTLPLAIYDAVQKRDYTQANTMVLVMTGIAFLSLWAVRRLERGSTARSVETTGGQPE